MHRQADIWRPTPAGRMPGNAPVAQVSRHGAGTWVTVEGEDIGYAFGVVTGALELAEWLKGSGIFPARAASDATHVA